MPVKKVVITDEVVAEWAQSAASQLASGWRASDVRQELTKAGCTPKLLVQIMKSAQSHTRAQERRVGLVLLVGGVLLIAFGLGVVLAQKFLFPGLHSVMVPSGLILCGLISSVKGLLKGVFG